MPLLNDLFVKGLRYVGTIRKNKRKIPDEMTDKHRFQNRQFAFVWDDNITLMTQCCPHN